MLLPRDPDAGATRRVAGDFDVEVDGNNKEGTKEDKLYKEANNDNLGAQSKS